MPKISVITCSVREEGIPLAEKALKRQTFKDFEHIVQGREGSMEGNTWTLNQDYNIAIRKAKGDLIISWQDFTYAKPDTLERFWTHYEQEPRTLVGAVGNKYADDSWTVMTWKDPRERDDQGPYYPCYFSDIEWNLAAIPKEAIYAVGGFDESMDKAYGMDAYSVNDRINLIGGYDFKLDQTIKSYSLEHGRLNGSAWDKNNWNGEPYQEHRKSYLANPKLSYLR
jgi:hypothetical protein